MSQDLVKTDIEWLSPENKKIIRSQFFPPNASDAEMQYCIGVAKAFNLNPILKQIYFVPRRSKVNEQWIEKIEPLAGRDSFLTLAHRSGKFDGIESKVEIKETPVLKDGKWSRENDLVATAIVYKKGSDRPFIVSVNYREYVQKTAKGDITQFWRDKPETMLKKVAESQVLRKAFDITGLYAEEEYNQDVIDVKIEEKPTKPKSLNDIQNKEIDYSVEILNKMIKNNVQDEKAKQYLSSKNDDELKELYNNKELFEDECMELIL